MGYYKTFFLLIGFASIILLSACTSSRSVIIKTNYAGLYDWRKKSYKVLIIDASNAQNLNDDIRIGLHFGEFQRTQEIINAALDRLASNLSERPRFEVLPVPNVTFLPSATNTAGLDSLLKKYGADAFISLNGYRIKERLEKVDVNGKSYHEYVMSCSWSIYSSDLRFIKNKVISNSKKPKGNLSPNKLSVGEFNINSLSFKGLIKYNADMLTKYLEPWDSLEKRMLNKGKSSVMKSALRATKVDYDKAVDKYGIQINYSTKNIKMLLKQPQENKKLQKLLFNERQELIYAYLNLAIINEITGNIEQAITMCRIAYSNLGTESKYVKLRFQINKYEFHLSNLLKEKNLRDIQLSNDE